MAWLGVVLLAGLFDQPMQAEVSLPHVLSDHMVVQRGQPVHVWGRAAAGESVSVDFRGDRAQTTADELGNWTLSLPPGDAGGPFTMSIAGTNRITLQDVLVGDVWVASGQSNMEFEMFKLEHPDAEIAAVHDDSLRLLKVDRKPSTYPRYDASVSAWAAASPQTAREFSAVAYYFARELREREHVPVGVIESSWGGTLADAWTSLDALSQDAGLMGVFAARARMIDDEERNRQLDVWERQSIADARAAGKPVPTYPWHPGLDFWAPGELYNGMIAPLTGFGIKGVIWYQGESNSPLERAPLYERVFTTMIRDWRQHWGQGDFPFLFVQIANFKSTPQEDWATVRDAQRRALGLANTGMAVTVDIGNPDNVHPTDKADVGHRLALWARTLAYGESVEDSGPLVQEADAEQGAVRVWFSHAASGLVVRGSSLPGFEVAGVTGDFVPAEAYVEGNSIVVRSPQVTHPVRVRYGWQNSPVCVLFNGAGLPASPFQVSTR
ncbi:MAG: sialate O-acetylesterase [Acidobacteriota bacterium]|nr:sialate O-acetylesterase [Acidobacteriota bacterium]